MSAAESYDKSEIIGKYRVNQNDTGSPEVQIALLTKRLEVLTEHFKSHPNDLHSQRGMFSIISRRKRLLKFLRGENVDRYRQTISALGLRK